MLCNSFINYATGGWVIGLKQWGNKGLFVTCRGLNSKLMIKKWQSKSNLCGELD